MNVHHCWENGILVCGDYGIAEDSRVWQCDLSNSIHPGSPATGYWSTGISAARSPVDGITTNAILRRNIVYNNWGEGLSSFEAEGTLIEDNIVYDNWSVNLYISDTRNALVQRNIVYNTPNNVVGQRRPFTLGDERADKPRSANTKVINNLLYNCDLWAFWSTGVPGSGLDNVLMQTYYSERTAADRCKHYDQAYNKARLYA
jgi:parallel beta-helix repeat protein